MKNSPRLVFGQSGRAYSENGTGREVALWLGSEIAVQNSKLGAAARRSEQKEERYYPEYPGQSAEGKPYAPRQCVLHYLQEPVNRRYRQKDPGDGRPRDEDDLKDALD